ncbi:putative Ribosomal protein L24e, partial [Leishmania naiffi]
KNPRFIPWTRTYRRIHRKTTTDRVNRRRAARAVRVQRAIVGADQNPRFIPWTRTYRRIHRKTTTDRVNRRRAARAVRVQRAIVGADLSYIQEVRATRKEDRSAKAKAVRAEVAERKAAKK